MLAGESDAYAGAIGRPDRGDRTVAFALVRPTTGSEAKAIANAMLPSAREARQGPSSSR
jgi:hypothetical protein